jgi:hypothetical protein
MRWNEVGGWTPAASLIQLPAHNIAKQFWMSMVWWKVSPRCRQNRLGPWSCGKKARKSVIQTIDSARDLA